MPEPTSQREPSQDPEPENTGATAVEPAHEDGDAPAGEDKEAPPAAPGTGPAPDHGAAPGRSDVNIRALQLTQLDTDGAPPPKPDGDGDAANMGLLLDVAVPVYVQLGSTEMRIQEILRLGPGSVVELDKLAGEPVDLFVRGKLLAQGEVVVVDENFGIRVTAVVDPDRQARNLP